MSNESIRGRNIVLVQRSSNRDGSAVSGLMIAKAMLGAGAQVRVVFGGDGEIVQDYVGAGCSTSFVPHGDWLRPAGFLGCIRRIYRERKLALDFVRILRDFGADLVYVNSLVSYAGALAGCRHSIPVIWHIRELFSDLEGELYSPAIGGKSLVRYELNRLATELVTISTAVSANVLGKKLAEKATRIPNAVSDSFEETASDGNAARRKFGFKKQDFVVGAVGSHRHVKGLDVLVESTKPMAEAIPNLVVAHAGRRETNSLDQLAGRLGVSEHVRFLGEINPIREFYDACDVICVPSRSESFGRVAMESMCAGVPVVCTAVGGLTDIIDHDVCGLVVASESPEAIAESVTRLWDEPDTRQRFVVAGQQRHRERYTYSIVRDRSLALVMDCLGNS